jgi:hypothetical protein
MGGMIFKTQKVVDSNPHSTPNSPSKTTFYYPVFPKTPKKTASHKENTKISNWP